MKSIEENTPNGHSIEEVVHIPDGVEITANQLKLASDFCGMSRFTRLIVRDPSLPELQISKTDTGLYITIQHRILLQPDLLKYTVNEICNAVMRATGYVSKDKEAKPLPNIEAASWKLPNGVGWTFKMPLETSGVQLIEAVRASNEFVWTHTAGVLAFEEAH